MDLIIIYYLFDDLKGLDYVFSMFCSFVDLTGPKILL